MMHESGWGKSRRPLTFTSCPLALAQIEMDWLLYSIFALIALFAYFCYRYYKLYKLWIYIISDLAANNTYTSLPSPPPPPPPPRLFSLFDQILLQVFLCPLSGAQESWDQGTITTAFLWPLQGHKKTSESYNHLCSCTVCWTLS